jgi:hypothetical protein
MAGICKVFINLCLRVLAAAELSKTAMLQIRLGGGLACASIIAGDIAFNHSYTTDL